MIRKRFLLAAGLGAICAAALLAGCSETLQPLAPPENLHVTDEDLLVWEEVAGADGYIVLLEGEEYETREPCFDIFELTTEYKTYSLKVKAYSPLAAKFDSSWAETEYTVYDPMPYIGYGSTDGKTICLWATDTDMLRGKLVLPKEIKGISNFRISTNLGWIPTYHGFKRCKNITSVIFADYANYKISEDFTDCTSLTRIKLPEFGTCTFGSLINGCSKVKELFLTKGTTVTSIGRRLSPDFTLSVDEDHPFYRVENNCLIIKTRNELVTAVGDTAIPAGIKTIQSYGLHDLTTPSVVIPEGVVSMTSAGGFCGTDIFLPASLTDIREGTWPPLLTPHIAEGNPRYEATDNFLLDRREKKLIANFGTGEAVIPDGIEIIASHSIFSTRLTSVTFGKDVRIVEGNAIHCLRGFPILYFNRGLEVIHEQGIYIPYTDSLTLPPDTRIEYGGIYSYYGCTIFQKCCELGYDGEIPYVQSIVYSRKMFHVVTPKSEGRITLYSPTRKGYTFQGWATEEGGEVVYANRYETIGGIISRAFTLTNEEDDDDYSLVPDGTHLYAVWTKD